MRPNTLLSQALSTQRKYHSYVNIDFLSEPPRLTYREMSSVSDINAITPNKMYAPRLTNG